MPEYLLESIGQRLVSGHDAASFRSACSPWRAAVLFATFGPRRLLLRLEEGLVEDAVRLAQQGGVRLLVWVGGAHG